MKNKKGFTLIELLVVIAIIGLLSTLAVVALNNARQKSRDARRISDIKQIQTALELYMNDNGTYPPDAQIISGYCPELTAAANVIGGCCIEDSTNGIVDDCTASTVYMNTIPSDPDGAAAQVYTYTEGATGATYTLNYTLEGETAGIPAGARTATPAGIYDE